MSSQYAALDRTRLLARWLADLAILIGGFVLLAWLLDWHPDLRPIISDLEAMKFNTALMIVLCAVALRLAVRRRWRPPTASRALALAAAAIALVTLAQWALGLDLGVDELVVGDPGGEPPGRPSVYLCLGILLICVGLLALESRGRLGAALAALPLIAITVAVVAYIYNSAFLRAIVEGSDAVPAPHATVALMLLAVGVLIARPERRWIALLVDEGPGGLVARRLLPLVVIVPLAIGVAPSLVDDPVAETGLALFLTTVLFIVTFALARSLELTDHERRDLEAELEREATHDPLTGIFNRRRLDEEFDRLLAMADRYGLHPAVLIADVDDFKQVNDTFGHEEGDRVLVSVAEAMKRGLRDSDLLGRFGGDEFLALIPEADEEAVRAAAGRIVDEVRAAGEAFANPELQVTVSVGVAVAEDGTRGQVAFEAADRALYRVKQSGGDGYEVAPEEPRGSAARG